MTTEEILQTMHQAAEDGDEILLADGFEDALLGFVDGACRMPVACYDYRKCVEILVTRDGMDEEEAAEYLDFNAVGAYMGPGTPLFLHNLRNIELGPVDADFVGPADSE
jgi:hypothetical protein